MHKYDLITVIIPVYNVEHFLEKCLRSISSQTYPLYEVLLINDGSTDRSGVICDLYSEKDKRFRVIHKKNAGVSEARNTGLKFAEGKYIAFLDGDDWVERNYLEVLWKERDKNKSDLVMGEYVAENDKNTVKCDQDLSEGLLTSEQGYLKILSPSGFYGSVWGELFCHEIIKRNHLKFNPEIRIGEDLLFVIEYLKYCRRICYSPVHSYHYLIRKGSALNSFSQESVDLKRLDIIKVYGKLLREAEGKSKSYKTRCAANYAYECADWFCKLHIPCHGQYDHLRKEALRTFPGLFCDKGYTAKNKINAVIKLLIPGTAKELMQKRENKKYGI